MVKKCEKNWCNIETEKFSGWIEKNNNQACSIFGSCLIKNITNNKKFYLK